MIRMWSIKTDWFYFQTMTQMVHKYQINMFDNSFCFGSKFICLEKDKIKLI